MSEKNKVLLVYPGNIHAITKRMPLSILFLAEALINEGFDPVLLDMQVPGMNGAEIAAEIRKIKKNIPIIAQTAFVFDEENNEALKAGCDACLVKPIRRDNLISVISSFTITA